MFGRRTESQIRRDIMLEQIAARALVVLELGEVALRALTSQHVPPQPETDPLAAITRGLVGGAVDRSNSKAKAPSDAG